MRNGVTLTTLLLLKHVLDNGQTFSISETFKYDDTIGHYDVSSGSGTL